jgi:hypothetical protein
VGKNPFTLSVLKKYNNSNIKPMLRFKLINFWSYFKNSKVISIIIILYLGTIGKVDIPFKVIALLFVPRHLTLTFI